jgi:signal transduction histidine kinase
LTLIDQILAFAKIKAGKIKLEISLVNLSALGAINEQVSDILTQNV